MQSRKPEDQPGSGAGQGDGQPFVMRLGSVSMLLTSLGALCLFILAWHLYEAPSDPGDKYVAVFLPLLVVFAALWMVVDLLTARIVCAPDSLSYRRMLRNWSLPVADIELAALETVKSAEKNPAVWNLPQVQKEVAWMRGSRGRGQGSRLLIVAARGGNLRIADIGNFDAEDGSRLMAELAVRGVKTFAYAEPVVPAKD